MYKPHLSGRLEELREVLLGTGFMASHGGGSCVVIAREQNQSREVVCVLQAESFLCQPAAARAALMLVDKLCHRKDFEPFV